MPLACLQIADHIPVVTMDHFEQNLTVQLQAFIARCKPMFKGK
jgi:hypothetical protein